MFVSDEVSVFVESAPETCGHVSEFLAGVVVKSEGGPQDFKTLLRRGLSDGFPEGLNVLVGSFESCAPSKLGDWGVEVVSVEEL